jgi:hypothetical protein
MEVLSSRILLPVDLAEAGTSTVTCSAWRSTASSAPWPIFRWCSSLAVGSWNLRVRGQPVGTLGANLAPGAGREC